MNTINNNNNERNIRPAIFLIVAVVLLATSVIKSVYSYQYDFDTFDDYKERVESYFDERIYVCMNLEELGGLDEDNDQVTEDNKKYCKELLEDSDYLKKKELIKKYGGELD